VGKLIEEFDAYRTKMNDRIMETANTNIKRFFALDTTSYADGALDVKTKEMLGLVASMVLRCDDCIKYHLGKCYEAGVKHDEMNEIFMIANLKIQNSKFKRQKAKGKRQKAKGSPWRS
jgi:AhpD family alkylhydroperoxidase